MGGRPFFRAAIFDWRAVFSKFLVDLTVDFLLTNFTLFFGSNYNGWYPWFVGLWVLGGGKSKGQVTAQGKKNVKILKIFKKILFDEINHMRMCWRPGAQSGSLLPLGFPGGNQVDGSPPPAT